MAFLDNSGDIILDAVLTDEGRRLLARGDGSFNVAKFALSDDEIDYSLYTATTSSGYQDLRIFQLPIMEASTNAISGLKSKLLTYTDSTLLYLPVIKLNTKNTTQPSSDAALAGGYYVAVDAATKEAILGNNTDANTAGYRFAQRAATDTNSRLIFDQGLDTLDRSLGYLASRDSNSQDAQLAEKQYIIEVDNRLLGLSDPVSQAPLAPNSVGDDNIASYLVTMGSHPGCFASQPEGMAGGTASPAYHITNLQGQGNRIVDSNIGSTTQGLLGSRLIFLLRSTLDLQVGGAQNKLFSKLGGTTSVDPGGGFLSFSFINTIVRVTGVTTGYRVETPLKLLKYTS